MLIGSQHYVFGSDLRRSLYIAEINHVTNQVYMSVKFLFIYKEMLILMYFVSKLHFFYIQRTVSSPKRSHLHPNHLKQQERLYR